MYVLTIDRDNSGTEHSMCKPIDVRKQGDTWIVKERCADHSEGKVDPSSTRILTTRYTRRGVYLYTK